MIIDPSDIFGSITSEDASVEIREIIRNLERECKWLRSEVSELRTQRLEDVKTMHSQRLLVDDLASQNVSLEKQVSSLTNALDSLTETYNQQRDSIDFLLSDIKRKDIEIVCLKGQVNGF